MPRKKTLDEFITQVIQKHGDIFDFTRTTYRGDAIKTTITCKIHGDFTPTPSNVLQGSGCPLCAIDAAASRYRKPIIDFINKANRVHNNKYDYSFVDYKNNRTAVVIICPTHGQFIQRPNVHTDQRCGCPKCSHSHGESEVREWLIDNGVEFTTQQMFDDCRDKRRLKFDFYIPSKQLLIEYNGIQHYRNVPLLKYSKDSFADVQRRDKIKVEFARSRGLRLLIVPYNVKVAAFLNKHISVDDVESLP